MFFGQNQFDDDIRWDGVEKREREKERERISFLFLMNYYIQYVKE
jgi:hypothetical protein